MDGVRRLSVSSRKHGKINQAFSPHEYSLYTLARCARRELSLSLLIVHDAQQRQQMSKNGYLKQSAEGLKGQLQLISRVQSRACHSHPATELQASK